MPLRSVEAATRDDAIAAAREQFGPSARVVGVRRVRSGGVLGFFATERYVAEVAPDVADRPAVPAVDLGRRATDDAPGGLLLTAGLGGPGRVPARPRPPRNGAAAWAAEAVRVDRAVGPGRGVRVRPSPPPRGPPLRRGRPRPASPRPPGKRTGGRRAGQRARRRSWPPGQAEPDPDHAAAPASRSCGAARVARPRRARRDERAGAPSRRPDAPSPVHRRARADGGRGPRRPAGGRGSRRPGAAAPAPPRSLGRSGPRELQSHRCRRLRRARRRKRWEIRSSRRSIEHDADGGGAHLGGRARGRRAAGLLARGGDRRGAALRPGPGPLRRGARRDPAQGARRGVAADGADRARRRACRRVVLEAVRSTLAARRSSVRGRRPRHGPESPSPSVAIAAGAAVAEVVAVEPVVEEHRRCRVRAGVETPCTRLRSTRPPRRAACRRAAPPVRVERLHPTPRPRGAVCRHPMFEVPVFETRPVDAGRHLRRSRREPAPRGSRSAAVDVGPAVDVGDALGEPAARSACATPIWAEVAASDARPRRSTPSLFEEPAEARCPARPPRPSSRARRASDDGRRGARRGVRRRGGRGVAAEELRVAETVVEESVVEESVVEEPVESRRRGARRRSWPAPPATRRR